MKPQAASGALKAGADFEQLEPQGFHPSLSELGSSKDVETKQHQQLVGQGMELESKGIGAVAVTGEPVGEKIALEFLDPVLTLSSVVIAVKDFFGSARSVGNDKTEVVAQRAHFDLDHDSAVFLPASGPVAKGIKNSDGLVRAGILAFCPLEPALGSLFEHGIGGDPDGIERAEGFQRRVDFRRGRAGIGPIADLAFGKTKFDEG